MAEVVNIEFDRRAKRIVKRHKRISGGYEAVLEDNGIIVRKPQRSLPAVSKTGIFLCIVALFGFKALLLETLGPKTYDDRVAKLANGTVIEQAGAFVMQQDPVSQWLVNTYHEVL